MGYTKNALSGFSWQTALKFAVGIITVLKISVVARILSPTEFGLFSITTIALGITEATTQTGVNFTIIQSQQSVKYFVNTAWVISIVRGLIIGIAMVILAFGLRAFFQEESLLFLITTASLIPVIKGFINPAIISYRKDLKFFNDSLYHFTLAVVEAIFAVILTILLKSVLALILAMMVSAFFEVGLSFFLFEVKPRFEYIKSRASIIINNAKWLSFSALFNYLHENLDNLLIGKVTSTYQLGLYHNSYNLGHKINYQLAQSATHGTLPILTKLTTEPKRLLRAFLRSSGAVMVLVVITSIPLMVFPEFFIKLVLGQQWLEAAPLLPWLVAAGLLQSLSALAYNLFLAQKNYMPMNSHLLISVLLMIGLILILGGSYGIIGAVIGIFLSRLITLPIIGYGIYKSLTT